MSYTEQSVDVKIDRLIALKEKKDRRVKEEADRKTQQKRTAEMEAIKFADYCEVAAQQVRESFKKKGMRVPPGVPTRKTPKLTHMSEEPRFDWAPIKFHFEEGTDNIIEIHLVGSLPKGQLYDGRVTPEELEEIKQLLPGALAHFLLMGDVNEAVAPILNILK